MNVKLSPGVYVVAVSGGVDSMALLHMLVQLAKSPELRVRSGKTNDSSSSKPSTHGYKLVVAHFDHGIRPDSEEDRKLVQQIAGDYGLPFVFDHGNLDAFASEAAAREARYKFLRRVREASMADAIITAHHQDDLIETAIINLLRGTGRKGISSLSSRDKIVRPLLDNPKNELRAYAKKHALKWREDATNQDTAYLRNYVRHKIVPKLSGQQRQDLLSEISRAKALNPKIDKLVEEYLKKHSSELDLDKKQFIALPHAVALEVMAAWLRLHGLAFDKKLLARLVVAAKTLQPGKLTDIDAKHQLYVGAKELTLRQR